MNIVAIDIGGTNARFALAEVDAGRVVHLGDPIVLPAARLSGLGEAWQAFSEKLGKPLPRAAAIGVAGPVTGGAIRFVNSHWVIDPATVRNDLGVDQVMLLNDFGAMAHAADALPADQMVHVCGPEVPLPDTGAISIIGPGTGLGVAVLQRRAGGAVVLETEGSHINFGPLCADEQKVRDHIAAARAGRCSVERIVSGPGLGDIVRTFAPGDTREDAAIWDAALNGQEPRALDIFLAVYGSITGDLALAHGAMGVVLTGGLTQRLLPHISKSRFLPRFCEKGRYRARMESTPVKLITHPQPGLFGAAAAFAKEHP